MEELQRRVSSAQERGCSPLHDGVVGAHAGRQQVVAVVEQLVLAAAVSHPDVRHARHAARQAQQVLPGAAVLVRDEQALVGRLALRTGGRHNVGVATEKGGGGRGHKEREAVKGAWPVDDLPRSLLHRVMEGDLRREAREQCILVHVGTGGRTRHSGGRSSSSFSSSSPSPSPSSSSSSSPSPSPSSSSPSSSSSSLPLRLASRSISDEVVSMKAKPMKSVGFCGGGPWVSATAPGRSARSVPLPEVLTSPGRWAEGGETDSGEEDEDEERGRGLKNKKSRFI
ncbi:hypothetical protein EYF80_037649 [Liparis tanakae]|uniref:Uncharacterized protein n=1 Tax=Liparis tanakae TaxID=230148 RepID=A0A4Z2GFQ0_9TELE|nr:hypothetical protein EYF80_037649 [Liparis tanakae]